MVTGTMEARHHEQAFSRQSEAPERPLSDIGERVTSSLIGRVIGGGAPETASDPLCVCGDPKTHHGQFGCETPDGPEDLCSCAGFVDARLGFADTPCVLCGQPLNYTWIRVGSYDEGLAHPRCFELTLPEPKWSAR